MGMSKETESLRNQTAGNSSAQGCQLSLKILSGRISIFDLDRTITRRGTYTPFLLHTAFRMAPWRLVFAPLVLLAMIAYRAGVISRDRLKETMHHLLIGKHMARTQVDAFAASFAEALVPCGCYPEALEALLEDRYNGRTVIIATAAHRFYAQAIASRLGADHVIATESVWLGDDLTPRLAGRNRYGPEKHLAIVDALAALGIDRGRAHIRFYSDNHSDYQTLKWCDEPVAVNPNGKLRRLAEEEGWQILNWGGQHRMNLDITNGFPRG